MFSSKYHKPVLVQEILSFIPANAKLILDATVGTGGHSLAIIKKFQSPSSNLQGLICLDFDCATLKIAQKRLKKYSKNIKFFCDNFANIKNILKNRRADFILADLGFSSWQLKSGRGVSFARPEPLDMRMDRRLKTSAADLVNHLNEIDLANLIYKYSNERFSRRIARAIVKKRPLYSTLELANLIKQAVGKKYARQKISPATRTFQALRIAVNQELENLEKFLQTAPQHLSKNGRLAIITFHSLEERLARDYLKKFKKTGRFKILTPQPVKPTQKEIQANPRARSAKLRVIQSC